MTIMLPKIFMAIMAYSTMITAHFILNIPTSLGFDDDNEGNGPCGGFNATNRDVVTNWHIKGDTIAVLTTHESVTWEYKAALVSDLNNWVHLTPTLNQTGVGDFCEPTVPGLGGRWLNKPVVLQVIQHGPDGLLYQCAAIKFVSGSPDPIPSSGCDNTTGIAAFWEKDCPW